MAKQPDYERASNALEYVITQRLGWRMECGGVVGRDQGGAYHFVPSIFDDRDRLIWRGDYTMGQGHETKTRGGLILPPRPTIVDVVSTLILDAEAYGNTRDVYDFAEEYGYAPGDADSWARADRAYHACRDIWRAFSGVPHRGVMAQLAHML